MGVENARILPIAESVRILLGVSTDHSDEGETVEDQDQKHLSARQPELGFTVCLNSEDITGTAFISSSACSTWIYDESESYA